ncbi:hypothetical protein [Candidatus Methanomethylophilus sp. 1R26]|uniref:hypothetical protein n=1 Tax=Candidatus Methanomethylophilus sp. 1R26 TaxID=1769296 RepID=UPI001F22C0E9|nr:hypothetical protein [Candidatus Methanomethylophilus sp. 1R26]
MASERKFVAENVRRVLLKEYLMKEVSRAGFGASTSRGPPWGPASSSPPRGPGSSSAAAARQSRT